jgi:hypothetical protein
MREHLHARICWTRRNLKGKGMRKRTDDEMHWEGLIRTMIDILGPERFNEVIEYVTEQMNAERQQLYHFAVETRRVNVIKALT